MTYHSKNLGRCLTEYKHVNYNDLEMQCQLFFTVSQFRDIRGMPFQRIEELGIRLTNEIPKCSQGMGVYGVMPDKTIIKLIEIVDSSD